MANSKAVSSTLPSREYYCKVCDLYLDTDASLDVHLQYHKENLYLKWGTQNSHNDTENNNSAKLKSETTVTAPADSSDNMITKPSPEFQQRATPETSTQFPHPATPQSYHSAPSPYQNPDQTNFSPGNQFGNSQFTHSGFQQNQHPEHVAWDQSQYSQDFHKPSRFHPYNIQDRVPQVSSSSPLYGQPLNQPTPSPSPNQCDKCGFVCDSAIQLNEHCNTAHAGVSGANTTAPLSFQQFQPKYTSAFQNDNAKVKEENEETSDILDLDSQKVVYPGNEEAQNSSYDQPQNHGRESNTRPVPMIPWDAQKIYNNSTLNGDASIFKDQKLYADQKQFSSEPKMYHPEQKFAYSQEKFLIHHDQKSFMHADQKMYPGVHGQMPPMAEYPGPVGSTNPDMKPPYRPYDSSAAGQITSTQPTNASSSALPPIGGKGANWKSNEARRPKTYNCTACNKWFTSSGHLKRHYNTTLHKNAVRSSGQPDPATMPISSHHHPSRDNLPQRGAAQQADTNTQSPVPPDDGRSVDDAALQSPYSAQGFDRSHRAATMQSKSPYSHLQQGNLDNNFMGNNPLANHPLSHQVGPHPLNISSQPPGIGNPSDVSHQGSKSAAISSTGNPPNGEAGPSVTQNLRGLLSVSTNNITTPVLTQTTPQLTPHTLPPFSHLAVNPYSPRSTDPLAPSVPDPTHTPLYLGQNFQQTIAPNYPNGMAPHVTDTAINNLLIANPATFGEAMPEEGEHMNTESSIDNASVRLPSFSQIQSQIFGVLVHNYVTSPNVGGHYNNEESSSGFVLDSVNNQCQYTSNGDSEHRDFVDYSYMQKQINGYSIDTQQYNNNYVVGAKMVKMEELNADTVISQLVKIEDIMDYANKENYESHMKSPASPESANAECDREHSPTISSTVVNNAPLSENNNHIARASTVDVHKCFKCDKIFNKACYLTQHNKSFHSGDKPFKCERCGKRYSDDVSYEEHFSKHQGIKPFKCTECPKSFNHKTDLRRHMCLHSGEKPYPCEHCGKGFIRKDHMLKHCETHKKKNRSS